MSNESVLGFDHNHTLVKFMWTYCSISFTAASTDYSDISDDYIFSREVGRTKGLGLVVDG